MGVDPDDLWGRSGNTYNLLYKAVEVNSEIALLMLDYGANPNNEVGYSPFLLALATDDLKLVEKFLEKGADPLKSTHEDITTVVWREKYIRSVSRQSRKTFALKWVWERGNEKLKALFCRYKYCPDDSIIDIDGYTMKRALNHGKVGIAKKLFANGATLDSLDDKKSLASFPFIFSMLRDPVSLDFILENGADPNKRNSDEATPLLYAFVDSFLMYVCIDCKTYDYSYVYHHFERNYQKRIYNILSLLLQHGADPNIPSAMGFTPLYAAIFGGNLEMVELLLQNGAHTKLPRGGRYSHQIYASEIIPLSGSIHIVPYREEIPVVWEKILQLLEKYDPETPHRKKVEKMLPRIIHRIDEKYYSNIVEYVKNVRK